MDKRKKSLSRQTAGIRGWIQAAATGACPIGAFQAVIGSSRFKCSRVCKMDVDVCKHPDHPECIRCGACIKACPKDAIHYRFMGK